MLGHSTFIALVAGALVISSPRTGGGGHAAYAAGPSSSIRLVSVVEEPGANERHGLKTDAVPGERVESAEQLPLELRASGESAANPLAAPPNRAVATLDEYTPPGVLEPDSPTAIESCFARLTWLGLRHSSEHGRNAGLGVPLVGTSWLNRPYYAGVELGEVWITKPPEDGISRDMDTFGGAYVGADWDYYWGAELAVERATPELKNADDDDAHRGDRLMIWTANLLYYPWGDSLYRPYWRCGIGAMEIDYPLDDGHRRDEALWAFPIGIGMKYPVRRWLAARAEFADTIGVGNTGVETQHDLSLTFALEWRFGVHPRSYWPWNPSRHIW